MSALPFIELLPDGKFRINPEAAEYLQNIPSPLAVVACAGKYRTGKSSLLNRVLLDVKGDEGFGVGQTVQACTKGLWMHTKVLGFTREDGSVTNFLIVDTEGLGAFNATSSHDSRIFSLALLISSYFIYNSVGTIDEQAISTLSLVANISKLIKSKSDDGLEAKEGDLQSAEELGKLFPDFLWVVRDFSLLLSDENGRDLTSDQYLEQALRDKKPDGSVATKDQQSALEEKNHLRSLLRAYFPRRQCVTMVRPCVDEEDLLRIDSMPKEQMRPEFLDTARKVRSTIFGSAPPKTVGGGKPLSGRGLLRLCETYVDAMNSGVAPVIRDSWALLTEVQFRDAIEAAEEHFRSAVEATGEGACDPLVMQKTLATAEREARQLFANEVPDRSGPLYEQFSAKLGDILNQLAEDARQTNLKCLGDCARNFLEEHVDNRQFKSWKSFIDTAYSVAADRFFEKIGRSAPAKAAWASQALSRIQAIAQTFGDKFDVVQAESERFREAAQKAEQWRKQMAEFEDQLRSAQTKLVEQEASAQAEREALEESLVKTQKELSDLKDESLQASSISSQEWQRKEQLIREETEAAVSEAKAVAEQATLELDRLKQTSEEARQDFQSRFDALQRHTNQSLAAMRSANEEEIIALQMQAEECAAQAEEAEARIEQYEEKERRAKRKFDEITQRLSESETQLSEVRTKFEQESQLLHEKWRQETKAQHEEKLELTRSAKVAEAKLALQERELASLKEKMQEERPNVEAERAVAALERVEQESQRLRSELFDTRRKLEEEQASVRKLERQLRDQQAEHEMAQHSLKMNYEVEAARSRAQAAATRRVSGAKPTTTNGSVPIKRAKLY